MWYNYVVEGEQCHRWMWPKDEELQFLFMNNAWGVTTAWLRQVSQRLVHHFASFTGEAAVHESEALRNGQTAPDHAKSKLLVRVRERVVERASG